MKKCFISLPITGKEDTLMTRVEQAKQEVIAMGYIPVSPLDINELDQNSLKEHENMTAYYMGRDIEALIMSDAIYSCEGWNESKGCLVERRCAEVYGLTIFEQ